MPNIVRLNRAVVDHKKMIKALEDGDRETLVEVSVSHQLSPEEWKEEVNIWSAESAEDDMAAQYSN